MASVRTGAPILPVNISQSPLLSGNLELPEDLFTTLAGPIPTITIDSTRPPASPRLGARQWGASRSPRRESKLHLPKLSIPLTSLASSTPPTPTTPSARIPPKQVISLLDLLERMESDVAAEVQRVRLGIQETRTLVRECREDSARRSARQRARGNTES